MYTDNDYQWGSVGNLTMLFQFERLHIDNGDKSRVHGPQLLIVGGRYLSQSSNAEFATFCTSGLTNMATTEGSSEDILCSCNRDVILCHCMSCTQLHICEGKVQIKLYLC